MTVLIKGTFKRDEREFNGLEAIHEELCEKMLDRHVIVAVIETHKVTKDSAGTVTPTVRLLQIEPLDGEAADQARELLDKAYAGRTGAPPPPPSLFDHFPADREDHAENTDDGERDPAAGPWPGDADWPGAPDMDAAVEEAERQGLIEPLDADQADAAGVGEEVATVDAEPARPNLSVVPEPEGPKRKPRKRGVPSTSPFEAGAGDANA